jgi:hypothetical protein
MRLAVIDLVVPDQRSARQPGILMQQRYVKSVLVESRSPEACQKLGPGFGRNSPRSARILER